MRDDSVNGGDVRDREDPQINLPGLGELREAVANQARSQLPSRGSLRDDAIAGLNCAVASVPSGLACGLLVGVSPVYGLYATVTGPIVGGFLASSHLMAITTTSAAALAAGQALGDGRGDTRVGSLFVLVIVVGILLSILGAFGLGRLTRFVSFSVMTGLLAGIGVLTILSQLPTVTGIAAEGDTNLQKAVDVFANLGQTEFVTAVISIITLVLVLVLPRTVLGNFGWFLAIAIPSLVVAILGLDSVEVVENIGPVADGLPTPYLPSLSDFTFGSLSGAIAVAVIIVVQGAASARAYPIQTDRVLACPATFLLKAWPTLWRVFFAGSPSAAR